MSKVNIVNIIEAKSRAQALSSDHIGHFVSSVFNKTIDDAQIGAFLMAVKLKGMNPKETADLSQSMAEFSEKCDFSKYSWKDKVVDKHSTGGVGDKISHILAPILAACGLKVPMISGRGLGITGGTIDKLESIKGFSSVLNMDELGEILDRAGFFIIGQTEDMVPVDKCLYAIRDVTSTVDSVPLITASILCKKKIEDLKILIMDIKYGKGTFMKDAEQGEKLALSMIETGRSMNMEVICLIDDMNSPLGNYIGNAVEMAEVLQALNGIMAHDIEEIVNVMVYEIMKSINKEMSKEDIENAMKIAIESGKALEHLELMLVAQGVESNFAKQLCEHGPRSVADYLKMMDQKSAIETEILSEKDGFIGTIDAEIIGTLVRDLNGGRYRKEDKIDYSVGVELCRKEGAAIKKGECWARIFHNRALEESMLKSVRSAVAIENNKPEESKRITKIMRN